MRTVAAEATVPTAAEALPLSNAVEGGRSVKVHGGDICCMGRGGCGRRVAWVDPP